MSEEAFDQEIAYNHTQEKKWTDEIKPSLDERRESVDNAKRIVLEDIEAMNISLQKAQDSKEPLLESFNKCKTNLSLAKTAVNQKQKALNQIDEKLLKLQPKEMQKSGPANGKT